MTIFASIRADGTTEMRQHVPFTVTDTGAGWEARDARTGRLMVRDYVSEANCHAHASSITEPFMYV